MGDSSDNIPGLPGVGEKTATKLIVEYGSIENVKEHAAEIAGKKARTAVEEHFDLAVLSKDLATIDTDAPIELDLTQAKAEGFYTREAYELCRRLEFKNLLGRFETAEVKEAVHVSDFFTCEDEEACRLLFEKAQNYDAVGISILTSESTILCAAVAFPDKETNILIPGAKLGQKAVADGVAGVADKVTICAMDIKSSLKHVSLGKDTRIFDAGVAAYLLNPLKSSYSYEDIAREYLGGMLVPSREELLGKLSFEKAMEQGEA